MPLTILPLLTIFGLNTLIGYYVLRKNPRSVPNRSFAFFAFSLAGWTLCIAVTHNIPGDSTLFARATFSLASVTIFALLVLFRTFPDETTLRWHWSLRLFCAAALILSALSFTPLIVLSATLEPSGLEVHYGRLHPLYAVYIYTCFATSILFLATRYRTSTGLVRLQFNYLFLGLLVPGLGTTITNLLVPLIVGISRTGQYGPYFAVVFLGFTAHALIHYRFMDIRLVLRRGMTFLLALLGSVLILITGSLVVWALVPFHIERFNVLLLLIGCTAISTLLPLLRKALGTLLDRYVYRQDIDYPRALHDASQALVAILDLDDLAAYAVQTILRVLRSETAALYLSRDGSFQLHREQKEGVTRTGSSPSNLPLTSPIVHFLSNTTEPLVAEEVPQRFPEHARQLLLKTLNTLGWALLLPIHSDNRLQGFFAVGPKLSADPFFPDELDFLEILANQVGIAVRNAELYKQVVLANEYIENILSTMESGVVAVDSHHNITLCNKAAEKMTGLGVTGLRDKGAEQLPPALWTSLAHTLADGLPRTQIESLLVDQAGRVTPIVCSTSPLRDTPGTILGAVIVFNDLTRLKDLEGEKRRSERLATFGALASGIAHEIKNPLVAIKTFAELLPERFTEVDFREGFAKVVVREIDRIDDLVDRLRGIAPAPLRQPAAVDMRKPLADTLTLLRGQLEQTSTTVHSEFHDPEPLVAIDEAQLKQLFLNLFLNAIQAMGSGGRLTIRIARKETADSPRVVVEVSDTGPGIPESIRANIFEPFFTTKTRGSGLGLAICRSIVDAHQGSIRAEHNSQRSGATIVVEFPLASTTSANLQANVLRH